MRCHIDVRLAFVSYFLIAPASNVAAQDPTTTQRIDQATDAAARAQAAVRALEERLNRLENNIGADITIGTRLQAARQPDGSWAVSGGSCPSGYKTISYICQVDNGGA